MVFILWIADGIGFGAIGWTQQPARPHADIEACALSRCRATRPCFSRNFVLIYWPPFSQDKARGSASSSLKAVPEILRWR